MKVGSQIVHTYIHRTITDVTLIEIYVEIKANKCRYANAVVVYASLLQSETEEKEKKTTNVRRYSLLKEGLYKAIAEKQLNGYQ